MAEQVIKNELSRFSTKYRAVCQDDSYKGNWRSTVSEAYQDARDHRQNGNSSHIIDIEVKQVVRMRFIED